MCGVGNAANLENLDRPNNYFHHTLLLISFILVYHFVVVSFGGRHLSPRSLTAGHLGNMVCVEGIVTKCKLMNCHGFVVKLLLNIDILF